MSDAKNYNRVSVLVVGAGPAGLSCAIQLKTLKPDVDVCVIELDSAVTGWRDNEAAKEILANKIDKDNVMFFLGGKLAFNIFFAIKLAKMFGLNFGQMIHTGDYSVSISKLTKWLGRIAKQLGAEVLTGFAAEDIIFDESSGVTKGVKLVDQGLDKEGNKQPNFIEGEIVNADFIVLAEGCNGLLTEKLIEKANLQRQSPQLYSVGVKAIQQIYLRPGRSRYGLSSLDAGCWAEDVRRRNRICRCQRASYRRNNCWRRLEIPRF